MYDTIFKDADIYLIELIYIYKKKHFYVVYYIFISNDVSFFKATTRHVYCGKHVKNNVCLLYQYCWVRYTSFSLCMFIDKLNII